LPLSPGVEQRKRGVPHLLHGLCESDFTAVIVPTTSTTVDEGYDELYEEDDGDHEVEGEEGIKEGEGQEEKEQDPRYLEVTVAFLVGGRL
jgi:hypothetical protein